MDENNEKKLDSKEGLADFFSDIGDDEAIDSEYDNIDQLIDEVLAFLENYEGFSGGLVTIDTLYEFLKAQDHPELELEDMYEVTGRLRTNKILMDEFGGEERIVYSFRELSIDDDMRAVINLFAKTPEMTKDQLKSSINWEITKIDSIIDKFSQQKLIKIENELVSFPGIPKI
jgi:hypothetical protein